MDLIQEGHFNLTGLSKINILLGKNGSGKSTLLKKVESNFTDDLKGELNYVTPERGGSLKFNSSVEQNDSDNRNWTKGQKNQNQWSSFKNYSVTQYRRLEILSLREIETNQTVRQNLGHTFNTIIDKINALLTNVKIVRTAKGDFELFTKTTDVKIEPNQISSGESELISLAIECLTFEKSCVLEVI